MAARNKGWVCGHSLAEITGSDPAGGHGCLFILIVLCCQVEVSATGRSLVQRTPTECGVRKAEITRGYFTRYSPASSVAR